MAFPLHARYAHPENGYQADQETAARHLTPGEVYTIRFAPALDDPGGYSWPDIENKIMRAHEGDTP
jgi:hypothetical protein